MKISILPQRSLRPYIDRYWVWEGEYEVPKILPGTGHELWFHYVSPFAFIEQDTAKPLPDCHSIASRHRFRTFQSAGNIGLIAVRFRSGAFRYFCQLPMDELRDCFVGVENIWGKQGREFAERVITAAGLQERVDILDRWLMKFFAEYAKPDHWLDRIIETLYYNYSSISLAESCQSWGISVRQLQRKFKQATGAGPKEFQQVSRFQTIVKGCLLEKRRNYLQMALDHGYYDQAHFIKEFQHFTGESPSAFFQEKNFMSHFYNRSRKGYSMI